MSLNQEGIQRFIDAWEKDFGERLSPDEARSELARLLDFFYVLAEAFPRGLTEV